MRWLHSQLLCVSLLTCMIPSILTAEDTEIPESQTPSVSAAPIDEASFVMPKRTTESSQGFQPTKIVPPAPTESSLPVEDKPGQPQTLTEPEEILGRNYNDNGWYSFPAWSRATWRPRSGDRFGEFSLESRSASPIDAWDGLSFTQGYGIYFLSGPNQTDMPPRLFEYQMGLHWFGELTSDLWLDLAMSAGLHTDFEDSTHDGWRVPAHAVMTWEIEEEIQPVFGVRIFDRNDLNFVPVAGVILKPDDDLRLELVYPEPRISWRIGHSEGEDHWLSFAGRIGGGEWAIERAGTDLADVATYNSYELTLGMETFKSDQSISAFELGYTFDRELLYRSKQGNYDPQDTYFLRFSMRK